MRNLREEVVFVGRDGVERKAWIAYIYDQNNSDDKPLIDVTFDPPGSKLNTNETLPVTGPTDADDANDPKFHPSRPNDQDCYKVPHEDVLRPPTTVAPFPAAPMPAPLTPFWRESYATMAAQVRREMPGKTEAEYTTEIDRRIKAATDARAEAQKAAKDDAAKQLQARKDEAAKASKATTVPGSPSGVSAPDRGSADYKAGVKAQAEGRGRDTTKSANWLAGWDGQ